MSSLKLNGIVKTQNENVLFKHVYKYFLNYFTSKNIKYMISFITQLIK